jgi:hypothetical protein
VEVGVVVVEPQKWDKMVPQQGQEGSLVAAEEAEEVVEQRKP